MTYKGIDISVHQGTIDYSKLVGNSNVEFIMLRAGYRGYGDGSLKEDPMFEYNYSQCVSHGIKVGAYFFSQAKNISEGREEACFMLTLLTDKKFDYPICIDSELSGARNNVGRADNISNSERTDAVKGFCTVMEDAGYYASIYCSVSWLNTKLNADDLKSYDKWLAKWSIIKPSSAYSYGMWQNSNNLYVEGINGRVDSDIAYADYTYIMRSNFLNGYKRPVDKYTFTVSHITDGDKDKFKQLADALNVSTLTTITKE